MIIADPGKSYFNALSGLTQMAQQQGQIKRQNALQDFYSTHGQALAQGDQGAINALADIDGQAAYQMRRQSAADARAVQSHEMGMQTSQANLRAITARAEREAARWAADKDAAEVERELANHNRVLSALSTVDSPEAWDALAQQMGEEELVGQFGQREALFAQQLGLKNALERQVPEGPMSPAGKLAADLAAGLITEDQYNAATQKSGLRVSSDGKGGVTFEQGAGVGGNVQKLTERQSQLALFGSMMDETMPVIDGLEESFDPANLADNVAARAGWGGNYFKSQDMQMYEAAGRAWAEGVLRIQTGAAATQPEIERVFATYFAQPGDSPETVAYKRRLRGAFAKSIGIASGGLVQPGAGEPSAPSSSENPYVDLTDEDFSKIDIQSLSSEQLDQLFEARSQ